MIALDTSAIIAILTAEAEAEAEEEIFLRMLTSGGVLVGAPTLVETRLVLESLAPGLATELLRRFIARKSISVVPFDIPMFEAASEAFTRFGKGRGHPARLNFGDCMAYGTAKVRAVPLLFKGNDFVHTDIEPAYRPVP